MELRLDDELDRRYLRIGVQIPVAPLRDFASVLGPASACARRLVPLNPSAKALGLKSVDGKLRQAEGTNLPLNTNLPS